MMLKGNAPYPTRRPAKPAPVVHLQFKILNISHKEKEKHFQFFFKINQYNIINKPLDKHLWI